MLKFFIDGSSKGLVVGAGVVEVNEFGFMTTHQDHKLHPLAESGLGELFALNLAMDKVLSSDSAKISIFVDTFRIENLFKHEDISGKIFFRSFESTEHAAFITSIREKIKTFYELKGPSADISICKLVETNFEYNVFTNTAHSLSRCYFKHYDAIYLDDNTPLKRNDASTKLEINQATKLPDVAEVADLEKLEFNIRIERKDGLWLADFSDSVVKETMHPLPPSKSDTPYVSSKHLVNAILYTKENIARTMTIKNVVLYISSSANIVSDVKRSVTYVNCPKDIKDKGHKILSMIEKGELVIN